VSVLARANKRTTERTNRGVRRVRVRSVLFAFVRSVRVCSGLFVCVRTLVRSVCSFSVFRFPFSVLCYLYSLLKFLAYLG